MTALPAERYGRSDAGSRRTPASRDFASRYAFTLDDFQVRACRELEDGTVACWSRRRPGPGKTIVGEFAVHLALESGRKCFYTTPIKALSNQKFNDLVAPLRRRQGRPAHR